MTAIVLYHVAIAAAVSGTFSPWRAGLDLVLSAVVALVIGVALGWAANRLMTLVGDATLQIGLTLLVPYAAYVLAEELHGSGCSPCSPPPCSSRSTPPTPTTS